MGRPTCPVVCRRSWGQTMGCPRAPCTLQNAKRLQKPRKTASKRSRRLQNHVFRVLLGSRYSDAFWARIGHFAQEKSQHNCASLRPCGHNYVIPLDLHSRFRREGICCFVENKIGCFKGVVNNAFGNTPGLKNYEITKLLPVWTKKVPRSEKSPKTTSKRGKRELKRTFEGLATAGSLNVEVGSETKLMDEPYFLALSLPTLRLLYT